MIDAGLVGEIENAIQARVMQGYPGAIGRSCDSAAGFATGNDLGAEMEDGHGVGEWGPGVQPLANTLRSNV